MNKILALPLLVMEENNTMGESYVFSLLLLILPLLFFIVKYLRSPTLPPGPFSWPIIGNILHLGKNPHVSLAQISQTHGPIISLRLGTQLLVVGSTPAAAMEILKNHDQILSGRFIPNAAPEKDPTQTQFSLAWADCTNQWKYLRTICRSELFSTRAMESQSNLRQAKITELIEFLSRKQGEVVDIGEAVFATVFNTLSNIFVSQDFTKLEGRKDDEGMKSYTRRLMELGVAPNLEDFYPILSGFDLQGLRKEAKGLFAKIFALSEVIMIERREGKGNGALNSQSDFLDALIANGLTNGQINYLLLELLIAGTDTTSSTTEWAMAELIKNQEAMKNVRVELETEINRNIVTESDLPHLPYLQSCVKETLRLHPPAPLLLPHRALETCKVMNYTLPKDSQVLVNVWSIGRDPNTWDDPLAFKPDRFLDSRADLKFNELEWLPFGAGRRICPGLPMATKQVALILASLINRFNWVLPDAMHPSALDMDETFGLTLQKKEALMLIPTLKR